jgi:hypothetical protein
MCTHTNTHTYRILQYVFNILAANAGECLGRALPSLTKYTHTHKYTHTSRTLQYVFHHFSSQCWRAPLLGRFPAHSLHKHMHTLKYICTHISYCSMFPSFQQPMLEGASARPVIHSLTDTNTCIHTKIQHVSIISAANAGGCLGWASFSLTHYTHTYANNKHKYTHTWHIPVCFHHFSSQCRRAPWLGHFLRLGRKKESFLRVWNTWCSSRRGCAKRHALGKHKYIYIYIHTHTHIHIYSIYKTF